MPDESKDRNPNMGYPSNSYTSRTPKDKDEPTDPKVDKKIEPLEGVQATVRKKPLGRRIAETLTGDDMTSVGEYLLFDVIIPQAKTTFSDMVSQGIERFLFGETRSRASTIRGGRPGVSRVSYDTMYSAGARREPRREEPRTMSRRARASHDFDSVLFESRQDAETALERMTDLIDTYNEVSVADFYGLVSLTAEFTDNKWGWTDLRDARAVRVSTGYILDLPLPKAL